MAPLRARIELDQAQVLGVGMGYASPLVAKVTRRTMNAGMASAPVKHGVMRASHRMDMRVRRTYVAGRVIVGAKYAEYVHNGTVPHTITARRKKALAFTWTARGGIRVLVPKKGHAKGPTGIRKTKKGVVLYIAKGFVRHPGNKARPWLYRALREVATPEGFRVQATFGTGNFIEFTS